MTHTRLLFGIFVSLGWLMIARAEISPETARVLTLDAEPGPRWVWVTDISYPNFTPGRAHLVDAGSGSHLGMITMGYGLSPLALPRHGRTLYSIETHYDRTARGNRTDVVAIYNPRTLTVESEIEIPPKKISGVTTLPFVGLTDDDRFLLIYNFTPAQSVTVVDLDQRKVASEISTAGCGLVFPAGARRFASLCSDGRLLDIKLSDAGGETDRTSVNDIFNPKREFLTEKAVRYGDAWVFVTNHGEIRIIDFSGAMPTVSATWPLFTAKEQAENWRIGGTQHLAIHEREGLLFAVVHQGEADTHKDPGVDVFVYDVRTGERRNRLKLERAASSILVTQDDAPLLLTTNAYPATLDIYDARTGKLRHTMEEVAITPMVLQAVVSAPR